jgi:hypothetical protein
MDFARFTGRRRCVAAVVGALGVAERVILDGSGRSFGTWADVLKFGEQSGLRAKASTKTPLFRVLIDRDKFRGLTHMQVRRSADLGGIGELLAHYAKHHLEKVDSAPLSTPEKKAAKDLIVRVATTQNWFADVLKKAETHLHPLSEIALSKFLSTAFDGIRFPHPDFPWMDITNEAGLMVEYYDPASEGDNELPSELYAVVREARGLAVEFENEMNLLVRDLLWLAPLGRDGNSERVGYYYSAYDAALYQVQVQSESINEGNIHADAVIAQAANHTNRFRLVYPSLGRLADGIEFRQGIISGTGRTVHQLAAWRAVLVDPSSVWDAAKRFQGLLGYMREAADGDVGRTIESVGFCGVLYGSKYDAGRTLDYTNREAFRRLATLPARGPIVHHAIQGFLREELRDGLQRIIETATEDGPIARDDAPTVAETLFQELEKLFLRRWHLFEPMQIVNFDDRDSDIGDEPTRENIERLLKSMAVPMKKSEVR